MELGYPPTEDKLFFTFLSQARTDGSYCATIIVLWYRAFMSCVDRGCTFALGAQNASMMNSQQKIGVLTFHRCINYGSYWQARCLVEGLHARGHDAVLLEHTSSKVNLAEWRCAFQPVLPTPTPKSDYPLYKRKMREFFSAFAALPRSPCFSLENPVGMESYDLVIVGSDEVWNLSHPWYGKYPLFYGGGIRAQRLVSYAASFGNYRASEGLEQSWADRLRRFDMISIRDENSRKIIKSAIGLDPERVLDPCLQFPPQPREWQHNEHPPYVALYGHNFTEWFRREVRRWADSRGYLLVSIGYRNDWADKQWITAGPEEFAHFIGHAEAVATNFFHGCVFSLVNTKPFVCELSAYRTDKVRDLMATICGEKHLVSQSTPQAAYDAVLDQPLDSEILHRISSLRQASNLYLDKVLS